MGGRHGLDDDTDSGSVDDDLDCVREVVDGIDPDVVAHSVAGRQALEDHPELLPIGDEPIEASIRWARIDADLRGVSVGDALNCRAAAHAALDGHRDVWDEAITEVDDGDGFRAAVAVAADSGVTLALVTAFNPMTVELPEAENLRRNESLFDEFRPPFRAIGRSPDGRWSEPGFAMRMGPAAIEAAQRFGQAAIYVVFPAGRTVLVVVGASPEQLALASLEA